MKIYSFLILFGALIFGNISSYAATENGSLVVTYRTDSKRERLDRIRFWLVEENSGAQTLYPRGSFYVDNFDEPSRMVVIENLAPGPYTLRFLVPNTDGYFQGIEARSVTISGGERLKVDQQIKPARSLRIAEAAPPEKKTATLITSTNIPNATLRLENEGNGSSLNGNGRSHTFEGLPPGNFQLTAESEDPFFVAPGPVQLSLAAGQTVKTDMLFRTLGKLYILSNLDSGAVDVAKLDNLEIAATVPISQGEGKIYLPEGEYRLFFTTDTPARKAPQPVDIKLTPLKTTEINAYFESDKQLRK